MNQFVEFMRDNWKFVVALVFCIVEIVFIFVKRKPKSIDDFKCVLAEVESIVPELVISRERPGEGELKKKEVIGSCIKLVERRLGRGLSDNEKSLIESSIDKKVEVVLTTPTRKEKINEE